MRVIVLLWLACLTTPLAHAAGEPAGERERIAIIGTGNVGAALGRRWGALGHEITYGSRDPATAQVAALVADSGPRARATTPAEAVRDAGIVVLAVPWTAAEEVVRGLGDLDGRVIIDPINPSRFADGRVELGHPGLAEQIASLAPGAEVVKALNTTSYRNMLEPPADASITVPLAGDGAEALARVARLVAELGLEPRHVGPLYNARYLEAMGNLYIYVNVFQRPEPRLEYRF
jgi:8-hydroxy-5-deazaflavin:NADPH oxidoreductase